MTRGKGDAMHPRFIGHREGREGGREGHLLALGGGHGGHEGKGGGGQGQERDGAHL